MPLPPPPVTYRCLACHWSKTVMPRSDALMRGIDYFDACQACGHGPLETQAASAARATVAALAEQIKRMMR